MAAPGIAVPGTPVFTARSLDEDAQHLAGAGDLAHHPHGFAIGLAATHGEGAEKAQQLGQTRSAHDLGLRQEVDAARAAGAEGGRIDEGEVIGGEYEPALRGTFSMTVGAYAPEAEGEVTDRRLPILMRRGV